MNNDNPYQDLKLLAEGTPLGEAFKEYILHCQSKTIEQVARAETTEDLHKLQGKIRLYNEFKTLPKSIKMSMGK